MNISNDVIVDTYSGSNNEDPNKFIWDEFIECVKVLEPLDTQDVKDYLNTHLHDDVEMIKEEFKNAFKDVPDDSKLKFETLNLLARIGIYIEKEKEKEQTLYDIKEDLCNELESEN